MTRWARGGNANKKKPHDATSWEELTQQTDKQPSTSGRGQTKEIKGQSEKNRQASKRTRTNRDQSQGHKKKIVKGTRHVEKRSQVNAGFVQSEIESKTLIDVLIEADKEGCSKCQEQSVDKEVVEEGTGQDLRFDSLILAKKERRREERRVKRQKKKADRMVCFHCRKPGHGVVDCPLMLADVEQGTGICFRCGSTEHDVSKCTAKVDKRQGEFPYAKCFICQETGHLSRSCPDNPRGLYPQGGACKECGSVEHRWWNCPTKKTVKGVDVTTFTDVGNSNFSASADAEPAFIKRPKVKPKRRGPKVVIF